MINLITLSVNLTETNINNTSTLVTISYNNAILPLIVLLTDIYEPISQRNIQIAKLKEGKIPFRLVTIDLKGGAPSCQS